MIEKTEAEKIEIVERRIGELSSHAMKCLEAGDCRPHLVSVDEELERVIRKCGVAKFRGLSIYRRDKDKIIRESHTHPAEKRLKDLLRSAERRGDKHPQIGVDVDV